jgi:hypothetical protein
MSKALKSLTMGMIIIAGISLFAYTYTAVVDVSGTWEVTSQGRQGEMTRELTIEQDGDKITVKMPGFQGDEMEGEGTVTDNKIEFTFNLSTPRGDFTLTYKGTIGAEGDTMSGEIEMGDFGSREWSAKKIK